jgi:hypothetical protein
MLNLYNLIEIPQSRDILSFHMKRMSYLLAATSFFERYLTNCMYPAHTLTITEWLYLDWVAIVSFTPKFPFQ